MSLTQHLIKKAPALLSQQRRLISCCQPRWKKNEVQPVKQKQRYDDDWSFITPRLFNTDDFFRSASSLMRDMHHDLDRMMRRSPFLFDNSWPAITKTSFIPSEEDLITVDKDGNRKFQIKFDMSEFTPEEVNVKTENGCLTITARKEKKTENERSLREFSQSYSLPADLKLEDLQSEWTEDKLLVIEGKLPPAKKVEKSTKKIAIEHK